MKTFNSITNFGIISIQWFSPWWDTRFELNSLFLINPLSSLGVKPVCVRCEFLAPVCKPYTGSDWMYIVQFLRCFPQGLLIHVPVCGFVSVLIAVQLVPDSPSLPCTPPLPRPTQAPPWRCRRGVGDLGLLYADTDDTQARWGGDALSGSVSWGAGRSRRCRGRRGGQGRGGTREVKHGRGEKGGGGVGEAEQRSWKGEFMSEHERLSSPTTKL